MNTTKTKRYALDNLSDGRIRILDFEGKRATKPMIDMPSRRKYLNDTIAMFESTPATAEQAMWEPASLEVAAATMIKSLKDAGDSTAQHEVEGLLMRYRAERTPELLQELMTLVDPDSETTVEDLHRWIRFEPTLTVSNEWVVVDKDDPRQTWYGTFQTKDAAEQWAAVMEGDPDSWVSFEQERAKNPEAEGEIK